VSAWPSSDICILLPSVCEAEAMQCNLRVACCFPSTYCLWKDLRRAVCINRPAATCCLFAHIMHTVWGSPSWGSVWRSHVCRLDMPTAFRGRVSATELNQDCCLCSTSFVDSVYKVVHFSCAMFCRIVPKITMYYEHLYSPRAEVTTIRYNTMSLKTKSKIQTW